MSQRGNKREGRKGERVEGEEGSQVNNCNMISIQHTQGVLLFFMADNFYIFAWVIPPIPFSCHPPSESIFPGSFPFYFHVPLGEKKKHCCVISIIKLWRDFVVLTMF